MLFPYQCKKCKGKFDESHSIGKAPRITVCPTCNGKAQRIYEGLSIAVSTSVVTNPSTFGKQMLARNKEAAHRMKGRKAPVRLEGYACDDGTVKSVAEHVSSKKV